MRIIIFLHENKYFLSWKKIFIYVQIIRLLQLHISNFITNRALDELRIESCLYTRHIKKMP